VEPTLPPSRASGSAPVLRSALKRSALRSNETLRKGSWELYSLQTCAASGRCSLSPVTCNLVLRGGILLAKTLRALFLGVTLVSLMVACAGYALLREVRAPAGSSSEPIELTVDPGDSTSAIATKLRSAQLIRQPLLFTLLVRSQGLDGKLQPGHFRLRPNMTM